MSLAELRNRKYIEIIEQYEDDDYKGYVGYYVGLPVKVYNSSVEETKKDLIGAKEEYFATAIKENLIIPKP